MTYEKCEWCQIETAESRLMSIFTGNWIRVCPTCYAGFCGIEEPDYEPTDYVIPNRTDTGEHTTDIGDMCECKDLALREEDERVRATEQQL